MMRSLLAALAAVLVAASVGCSSLSSEDETIGWSAQRLYGEAKDAMASREWQKSIKYLEKLEARYPYGRYAQQAQLEVAYANWKGGERARFERGACRALLHEARRLPGRGQSRAVRGRAFPAGASGRGSDGDPGQGV